MNTLSQLEQQAKEMQAKLDEMKATIEAQRKAEEDKQNLKSPFGIGSGEFYYVLSRCFDKGFEVKGRYDLSCFKADTKYIFNSQESAENWADAFRVILELRSCEGVEANTCEKQQYYVFTSKQLSVYVDYAYVQTGFVSPAFSTEESAKKAMLTVGEERISKAFKTLMGLQQ
jgi:hypothetical protein